MQSPMLKPDAVTVTTFSFMFNYSNFLILLEDGKIC